MKPVVDEMIDMKKTNEAENQKYQEQFMEQTSVPDHVDRFRNIAKYCMDFFTIVKSFANVIV